MSTIAPGGGAPSAAWRIAAVAVVLVATTGCTSNEGPGACGVAESAAPVGRSEESAPEDLLWWAGFSNTKGLTLVGSEERCGLDALAVFALRGTPEDIDAALEAAGFDVAAEPGLPVFERPIEGADLEALADPWSAEQQQWENDQGEHLVRKYVRGGVGGGEEELHVWAFTT
jgi:hypothetical protein